MANVKIKDLDYGIHFRFNMGNESGVSTTRIDDILTLSKYSISVGDILKIEEQEYSVGNISINNISEYPYNPNFGLDRYGHEKLDREALMCIEIDLKKLS